MYLPTELSKFRETFQTWMEYSQHMKYITQYLETNLNRKYYETFISNDGNWSEFEKEYISREPVNNIDMGYGFKIRYNHKENTVMIFLEDPALNDGWSRSLYNIPIDDNSLDDHILSYLNPRAAAQIVGQTTTMEDNTYYAIEELKERQESILEIKNKLLDILEYMANNKKSNDTRIGQLNNYFILNRVHKQIKKVSLLMNNLTLSDDYLKIDSDMRAIGYIHEINKYLAEIEEEVSNNKEKILILEHNIGYYNYQRLTSPKFILILKEVLSNIIF